MSGTLGDLNGDGKDEIILDGIDQNYNGQGNWAVYTKIYELKNSDIVPGARQIVFKEPQNYSVQPPEFGCTAGKFTKDSLDQVALVCAANESSSNKAYVFIYMLKASSDLSTLNYDPSKVDSNKIGTSGSLTDFSITSGDLNNDGSDELIYDLDDFIYVYSTDDLLNLTYRLSLGGLSGGSEDDQLSYDFITTGILNQTENHNIIVVKDIYGIGSNHWFEMAAYGVNQDLTYDSLIASISSDTTHDTGSHYHYAVAVGSFDGGNFSIGEPQHTVVNDVVQPLVVLNTPPIHFDIINGRQYDLSNCFSGNGCSFYSTYIQQNSSTVNLQTQTHNDVSSAAGINLSGSTGIQVGEGVQYSASVNFNLKIEKTWGHSFASDTSSTQTTLLEIGVSAMDG